MGTLLLMIETMLLEVASNSECSICLPFELSIVDLHAIAIAMRKIDTTHDTIVEFKKEDRIWSSNNPSAYDLNNFVVNEVLELPASISSVTHVNSASKLLWDHEERFSLLAGSKQFCELAFPQGRALLEYYYLQQSLPYFPDEKHLIETFSYLTNFS